MGLRGFGGLHYWADDVAEAVAWYTQLLEVEPTFVRPGPGGRPSFARFRVGDDELSIADRAFAPSGASLEPGGAVMHWRVDSVAVTLERLHSMGAEEYQAVMAHGPSSTAAVVDPFGNLVGLVDGPQH